MHNIFCLAKQAVDTCQCCMTCPPTTICRAASRQVAVSIQFFHLVFGILNIPVVSSTSLMCGIFLVQWPFRTCLFSPAGIHTTCPAPIKSKLRVVYCMWLTVVHALLTYKMLESSHHMNLIYMYFLLYTCTVHLRSAVGLDHSICECL